MHARHLLAPADPGGQLPGLARARRGHLPPVTGAGRARHPRGCRTRPGAGGGSRRPVLRTRPLVIPAANEVDAPSIIDAAWKSRPGRAPGMSRACPNCRPRLFGAGKAGAARERAGLAKPKAADRSSILALAAGRRGRGAAVPFPRMEVGSGDRGRRYSLLRKDCVCFVVCFIRDVIGVLFLFVIVVFIVSFLFIFYSLIVICFCLCHLYVIL